jgi:hypothetical protein
MIVKTWGSAELDESTALEDTANNGLLTLLTLLERNLPVAPSLPELG